MKHRNIALAVCLIVLGMLMAGCGSSSKSASGDVSGVFADAPVQGVSYSCGGQQGVTDLEGTYQCPANSTVTFSVGAVTLCSAPAKVFMTPLSCTQAADATANTSTPSVLAVVQFLVSISTTPASFGQLTITPDELQAAANLSLNLSTATQSQLQTAVSAISPGATLVSALAAQNELNATVLGGAAGNYSGWFSGGNSGSFTVTLASSGNVAGTFADTKGDTGVIAGALLNGTQYQGTAGTATWTGNLDTSKTPVVLSGTWSDAKNGTTGSFTGHN